MIRTCGLTAILILAFLPSRSAAQDPVRISGTTFGDYYYVLETPDEEAEEENGFTIRRMYLTADFSLPRGFGGRARLEANQGSAGTRGMEAFVKDLFLRWRSEGGHAIRLGIMPIPHWEDTAEDVWGYRSLEATVMDVLDVAESRDMGIRFDGPLLPDDRLSYSVMAGNGNAQLPESDEGKRVYAALTARPGEHLVVGVSADYAGYTDDRTSGATLHAFAGYEGDRLAAGVEPFWNRIELREDGEAVLSGLSVFAHVGISEAWRVIGRVDLAEPSGDEDAPGSTLGIVALSFEPISNVRLMPNVWILKLEGADSAEVLGRFTFEFRF